MGAFDLRGVHLSSLCLFHPSSFFFSSLLSFLFSSISLDPPRTAKRAERRERKWNTDWNEWKCNEVRRGRENTKRWGENKKNQLWYSSCPSLLKGPGDVLRWPFDRLFSVYCSTSSSLLWQRAGAARARLELGIWKFNEEGLVRYKGGSLWRGGNRQNSKAPIHPLVESVRSIFSIHCDCIANSAAPIQPRSPTGLPATTKPHHVLCAWLWKTQPSSPLSVTLLPIVQCSSERL